MDESTFDADLRRLASLGVSIDDLDSQRKLLNEEYEELSYRLAIYMDQTGVDSKKLDGINFIKSQRAFAKVEDKAALMEWIKQNAAYDLLMAINSSKITGYCNECLETGLETPPGVNPGYIKHSVTIRRNA
jgi:hypothetical protein